MTRQPNSFEASVHIAKWGSGPRVVLVHGNTLGGGTDAFSAQRPLSARWQLLLPDRPGHGLSPRRGREDFERDAHLLLPLLSEPAHLVGHSYGAIVAMLMAVQAPQSVRSLVLIEPPAYGFVREDGIVEAMAQANRQLFEHPPASSMQLLSDYFALTGTECELPDVPVAKMSDSLKRAADALRNMRSPDEAEINAADLRAGHYPIFVLTSGRTPAFEAIATALETQAGAQHIVIPRVDHTVQARGEAVNPVLEAFWTTRSSFVL